MSNWFGGWFGPHRNGDDNDFTNREANDGIRSSQDIFSLFRNFNDLTIGSDPPHQHSPRDSMLKVPEGDSNTSGETEVPHRNYEDANQFRSPIFEHPFSHDDQSESEQFGEFGGSFMFSMSDPFRMMEDMLRGFGPFNFDHNTDLFESPHPIVSSDDSEKMDTDLDHKSDDVPSLLKDKPSYSVPSSGASDGTVMPVPRHGSPGTVTGTFKSSSVTRIRKADGTIEETHHYKDSTGREETTTTTYESQANDAIQPTRPNDSQQYRELLRPFSWFFR